jgi:three-Cys-motif partner protein
MLRDSAQVKWQAREHTKVKHELLEKYLRAWIPVLAKWNPKIGYFDGFAGRGEYEDGSLGSPVVALQVADARAAYYGKMVFFFIEKDKENFQNLKSVLAREIPRLAHREKMVVITRCGEFADIADELFSELGSSGKQLVPSFFFIDPFGFSGVPFDTVKRILGSDKTEVFFNFMVGFMKRFTKLPTLAGALRAQFGCDDWQSIAEAPDRERALVGLYRRQLHESAKVKYSLQFRVCSSVRRETLYYLIHATNSFLGHDIMKSVMYNQGANGTFCYLGPGDRAARSQLRLFDANDPSQLREFLLRRFAGKTRSFDEIREQSCHPWSEEPPYIEKHYREVIKALEKEGAVTIQRVSSKTARGLGKDDMVHFRKRPS